MDRNSTNFQAQLSNYVKNLDSDQTVLRYSQWLVKEYISAMMQDKIVNKTSGIILNHEMGTGKTIAAITIADMLQKEFGRKVIVIGPKSLSENFEQNKQKLEKMTGDSVLSSYKYFTSRANNLEEQIRKSSFGFNKDRTYADAFNNTVVVLDEFHLLSNSIAHGRSMATALYNALFNAKNCFKVILTGTLVINSPFESVPSANLCLGKHYFPEDKLSFDALCGTVELQKKNRSYIQNGFSGILSYVYAEKGKGNFPAVHKTKIISLPMSGEQEAIYTQMREIEQKEAMGNAMQKGKKGKVQVAGAFMEEESGSSSYRVRSRIASNGPNKWDWIAKLVMKYPNDLIAVQCHFVDKGGCRELANYLKGTIDYKEMLIDPLGNVIEGVDELKNPNFVFDRADDKTYSDLAAAPIYKDRYLYVLDGSTNAPEQLKKLISVLTDHRNRYGAYCHLLIMSTVGMTGLDLKYGRHIVYTSPFFQLEEFNQLKGRYVRDGSSKQLLPEEQNVQPYILMSKSEAEKVNTDEHLLIIAMNKMKENTTFTETIRSVSIECLAGQAQDQENCRYCLPNGKALTYKSFLTDSQLPSNCIESRRIEIMDGDEMKNIFQYVDQTGKKTYIIYDDEGGIEITPSHPMYKMVEKLNDE